MTPLSRAVAARSVVARTTDALLEATVVGSFSRIGLAVRSRLLPEFTAETPPAVAGRVALITGATSGIGRAAAIRLARLGMTVHFLARDGGRAARAQREITAAAGRGSVSYGLADLDDQDSVRDFAREFLARRDRLDVLIHNAGTIHPDYRTDDSGIELTVSGQVIAPFQLTELLLPALSASAISAAAPGRVITVSSGGMYTQRFDPATLAMPEAGYRGVTAYARAKRAQVVLSREWAQRIDPARIAFHAMHPGWADTAGIAAALPGFRGLMRPVLRSPDEGADTIVWLATAPAGQLGSGRFWHDRRPRSTHRLPRTRETDPAAARQLWECLAARTLPAA